MDFYVYILKCNNGSYYVGHTDNLEKRIFEHKTKVYSGYTSKHLPVELVFYQTFASRHEAQMAEQKLKRWTREKKEALISGGWEAVKNVRKKQKNN